MPKSMENRYDSGTTVFVFLEKRRTFKSFFHMTKGVGNTWKIHRKSKQHPRLNKNVPKSRKKHKKWKQECIKNESKSISFCKGPQGDQKSSPGHPGRPTGPWGEPRASHGSFKNNIFVSCSSHVGPFGAELALVMIFRHPSKVSRTFQKLVFRRSSIPFFSIWCHNWLWW